MKHIEPALGQIQPSLNSPGEVVAKIAGRFFTDDLAQRRRGGFNQSGEFILVDGLLGIGEPSVRAGYCALFL